MSFFCIAANYSLNPSPLNKRLQTTVPNPQSSHEQEVPPMQPIIPAEPMLLVREADQAAESRIGLPEVSY